MSEQEQARTWCGTGSELPEGHQRLLVLGRRDRVLRLGRAEGPERGRADRRLVLDLPHGPVDDLRSRRASTTSRWGRKRRRLLKKTSSRAATDAACADAAAASKSTARCDSSRARKRSDSARISARRMRACSSLAFWSSRNTSSSASALAMGHRGDAAGRRRRFSQCVSDGNGYALPLQGTRAPVSARRTASPHTLPPWVRRQRPPPRRDRRHGR